MCIRDSTLSGSGGGGADFGNPCLPPVMVNAAGAVLAASTLPPLIRRVPKGNILIRGEF